jgi:hypothetical protein
MTKEFYENLRGELEMGGRWRSGQSEICGWDGSATVEYENEKKFETHEFPYDRRVNLIRIETGHRH